MVRSFVLAAIVSFVLLLAGSALARTAAPVVLDLQPVPPSGGVAGASGAATTPSGAITFQLSPVSPSDRSTAPIRPEVRTPKGAVVFQLSEIDSRSAP